MNIIIYDFGTSSLKACLFDASCETDGLRAFCSKPYPIYYGDGEKVEQHEEDWWNAACEATKQLLQESALSPGDIGAISFCCQMGALIPVDREGKTVIPPISLLDDRAKVEFKKYFCDGLIRAEGRNVRKVLQFLSHALYMPYTSKEPFWKYIWIRDNMPDVYNRIYKCLDVIDWLLFRCTGRFVRVMDNAQYTSFLDRKDTSSWNDYLCRKFGLKKEHLPEIVKSTSIIGGLLPEAAAQLGLNSGIPIVAGASDVSCIPLGAGLYKNGQCSIYCGTSGMVETVTDRYLLDVRNNCCSLRTAIDGMYFYSSEIALAGKCVDAYVDILYPEKTFHEKLEHFYRKISNAPVGCGGMIFAPWFMGIKSPRSNSDIGGMAVGLKYGFNDAYLGRALAEGLCFQYRWIVESQQKKIRQDDIVRFVGGTSCSDAVCQILSDVLGRPVEVIEHPELVGCYGALTLARLALGLSPDIAHACSRRAIRNIYTPSDSAHAIYQDCYARFLKVYDCAKKMSR